MTTGAGLTATRSTAFRELPSDTDPFDTNLDLAGPFEDVQEVLRNYLQREVEAFLQWWGRDTVKHIRAQWRAGRDELAAKEIRRIGGRYYVYTTTGQRRIAPQPPPGARRRLRQVEFFARKDVPTISDDPAFWSAIQRQFDADLSLPVQQVMTTGALAPADLGLAVNFGLINQPVAALAKTFTHEWWEVLGRSTRDQLRGSISTWLQTGKPLSVLIRDIEPLFGRRRAEMIAATETTRLFAEGNAVAYRTAGVNEVEWYTARDDRVCPVCGPLHGERYGVGTTKPPAHPRCRCWMAPVVDGVARTRRTQAQYTRKIRDDLMGRARAAEPKITSDLTKMTGQWTGRRDAEGKLVFRTGANGPRLLGGNLPDGLLNLDYRLKSADSLYRKINGMFNLEGIPVSALGDVTDVVRYTRIFSPGDYAGGIRRTLSGLEAQGYNVVRFRNSWYGVQEYRGVNTLLRAPDGQIFELQFHTPHSFHNKEFINHPLYETQRKLPRKDPRYASLTEQMAANAKLIQTPDGITRNYTWATQ